MPKETDDNSQTHTKESWVLCNFDKTWAAKSSNKPVQQHCSPM